MSGAPKRVRHRESSPSAHAAAFAQKAQKTMKETHTQHTHDGQMVEPSSREYLSASGASFFFALKDFFCVNMNVDVRESDADETRYERKTMEKIIRKRILFNR